MNFNIRKIFNKKEDACGLSLPKEKTLFGVSIRKQPNGAYIKTFKALQDLPGKLIQGCFPDTNPDKIIEFFEDITVDKLPVLLSKLLATVPEEFLKFVSEITEIPYEKLLNELTPYQTAKILEEFWRLNDMTDFFTIVKRALRSSEIMKVVQKKN
jgi:hypothetical protein